MIQEKNKTKKKTSVLGVEHFPEEGNFVNVITQ